MFNQYNLKTALKKEIEKRATAMQVKLDADIKKIDEEAEASKKLTFESYINNFFKITTQ